MKFKNLHDDLKFIHVILSHMPNFSTQHLWSGPSSHFHQCISGVISETPLSLNSIK